MSASFWRRVGIGAFVVTLACTAGAWWCWREAGGLRVRVEGLVVRLEAAKRELGRLKRLPRSPLPSRGEAVKGVWRVVEALEAEGCGVSVRWVGAVRRRGVWCERVAWVVSGGAGVFVRVLELLPRGVGVERVRYERGGSGGKWGFVTEVCHEGSVVVGSGRGRPGVGVRGAGAGGRK